MKNKFNITNRQKNVLINILKKEQIELKKERDYQIEQHGNYPAEEKKVVRPDVGPHYGGISNLHKVEHGVHDYDVHEVIETLHKENQERDEEAVVDDMKNIINRIEE